MKRAGVLLGLWLLCLPLLLQAAETPTFTEVQSGFRSSYAELLDRNGKFLHARRVDMQTNRLRWVPLAEISPALTEAVVFAEDREFWDHGGVDWSATALAAMKYVTGDKSRGASTITMQLAGLVNDELAWRRGGRSLGQKWNQMQAARALEKTWSKAQIIEAYLNLVSFRGDLQGVAAVSAALFGKVPAGLTRNESLLLASLLPSPQAVPGRVATRACVLINAGFMEADCNVIRDLAMTVLAKRLAPYPERPALEAISATLLTQPDEQVRSTLDGALQQRAEILLHDQLAALQSRQVQAGAVLVLDNASGEVLAYVANAGRLESARFVDGVQALRQAGSTLKPFLYELAFERQYLTAASVLEDTPVSFPTPTGLYVPQNYEKDFKGPVSARVALASSLNVPAVRVLALVGVENAWMRLRDLGLALPEAPEFYGHALALGSADVTLWTLTNAYRTLARGGSTSPPSFLTRPAEARRLLDENASFITADILSDRSARALTFGLESPLSTPFWTAVKTGTSKDMRDNWAVGFSQRYTVGVWVGNFDGSPMHEVSGISGAAPVWAAVMQHLEGGRVRPGGSAPMAPLGLVRQRVGFSGVSEPAREEWFVRGTELARVEYTPQAMVRIVSPVNETVIAIDPDIPLTRQQLRFRAETPEKGLTWWLDDKPLGAAKTLDWTPLPGRHRLVLKDARGIERDAVVFTVRGRQQR
ncbi:MAG: penicillin-binding protein 1C [Moraxellaceae bacterium]|nr:penicillin-binding protein 1C [Moraxellaceae bacterium]